MGVTQIFPGIEAKSLYHLLFLEGRDPIFWADAKSGTLVNCNPAAEKLLGRPREEIIGKHQSFLHPPKDSDLYMKIFRDHAASPGTEAPRAFVQRSDGSTVPVDIISSAVTIGENTLIQGVFRDISAFVNTCEELAGSEARYRNFIEESLDLATEVDQDGRFTYLNGSSMKFYGLLPDECIGRSAFDFIHPDDRSATIEWFNGCIAAKLQASSIENRQLGPKGVTRRVHWSCAFHYDAARKFRSVSSLARDVTRAREMEHEIRRRSAAQEIMLHILKGCTSGTRVATLASETIRSLISSEWFPFSRMGAFYVADPARPGTFALEFSQGFPPGSDWICREIVSGECFCGRAAEEKAILFSPSAGSEHCERHPQSPGFAHYCCPVIYGETTFALLDIYLPEGSADLDSAASMLDSITGTLAVCLAHENAAARLRESTDLYRNLVESLKDYYYFFKISPNRVITYLSPSAERILGKPIERVIGSDFRRDVHPDDISHANSAFEGLLTASEHKEIELRLIHGDGSPRHVRISSWPDLSPSGKAISVSGVVRDMTSEKAQEMALSESLKEKEVLLRELHHRVKNNMQIIQSLTRLQARSAKTPDAVIALEEIGSRVRAIALIHEAVYGSSDLSSINLWDYLDRLVRNLRDAFHSPEVSIVLEGFRGGKALDLDSAVTVGLAVNELVSNATKHAFPANGKGNIRVRTGNCEPGEAEVTVSDDGTGFDPSRFLSGSPGKGSFGLYMVKHMVETQLGGRLEVSSGPGTTWRIFLKSRKEAK